MTIVYLIFIALAAYFSFRYDGVEEYDAHKNHRFWFLCVFLICISGFSYGLGGDKFAYMEDFENADPNMSYSDFIWFSSLFNGHMPGWSVLVLSIKKTFDSFYLIQFAQSTIVNVTFCYLIKRYTHRIFLFLLLYFVSETFFQFNTEVMREGIAIAFSMIAIEYHQKSNKILFFTFLIFAILFHVSAIVLAVYPFCPKFSGNKKTLLIIWLLSFLIWIVSDIFISKILPLVFGGRGTLVQKLLFYSSQGSTIFGYLRNALRYLVFPSIIIYSCNNWYKENYSIEELHFRQKIMSYILFLGVIACSLTGLVRFQNYTQIYYLVIVTDFVYVLFSIKKHLVIRCATAFGASLLLVLNMFSYWPGVKFYFYQFFIPYTCILDEDPHVFIRKTAHNEATTIVATDKNQRDIKD